jgi:hypothetical protein
VLFHKIINLYLMEFHYRNWFADKMAPGLRYFVYPLHYEPEASTTVRAYYFSDQMATIKLIAKCLPLGIRLAVKEHRGNRGYRKTGFYKELSYLPNVVLLSPDSNVLDLVRDCIAVITLTGRMGWEAIVNGKPVIALGRSFWSSFDSVHTAESWRELVNVISSCCDPNRPQPVHDEQKVLAFTAAYIQCIWKGNFVFGGKQLLTGSNIADFANMLMGLASLSPGR